VKEGSQDGPDSTDVEIAMCKFAYTYCIFSRVAYSEPDPYVVALPDPDPLIRRTDPDPTPDSSIMKQKKTLNAIVL